MVQCQPRTSSSDPSCGGFLGGSVDMKYLSFELFSQKEKKKKEIPYAIMSASSKVLTYVF